MSRTWESFEMLEQRFLATGETTVVLTNVRARARLTAPAVPIHLPRGSRRQRLSVGTHRLGSLTLAGYGRTGRLVADAPPPLPVYD